MAFLWGSVSEWVSEWVIEWRARADNMLTDWQMEATVISIDPSAHNLSRGRFLQRAAA